MDTKRTTALVHDGESGKTEGYLLPASRHPVRCANSCAFPTFDLPCQQTCKLLTQETSATPKPRAGEHTWHDDKMLIFALREENDALREQVRETREMLVSFAWFVLNECLVNDASSGVLRDKARAVLTKAKS